MYRSLLVPLDGSSLAEQALPLALSIARRADACLDLVEVHALYALGNPHAAWGSFEPEEDTARKRQEQAYLDATARWVTCLAAVTATADVLPGSVVLAETVADSILERARAGKADLIVMATHGRGPLGRCGFGSVADELLRRARTPVLLVRPGPTPTRIIPEPVLENVLIPLDGSALAEQALEPALELACLMGAKCNLLRVVDSRFAPGEAEPGGPPVQARAEAYLECIAGRLRGRGLQVRTRVVVARHAARAILAEAAAQTNDLIALSTHGRGGLTRLLLGSVADKLLRRAPSPVLIYRPAGQGPG